LGTLAVGPAAVATVQACQSEMPTSPATHSARTIMMVMFERALLVLR